MKTMSQPRRKQDYDLPSVREMADQAFSRAAGAPLIGGNHVRLLKDAPENYGAWLKAMEGAEKYIHFENYIICDDAIGRQFEEIFIRKAREGVAVRIIYDWLGTFGKSSRRFWNSLSSGGVEVRCYNSPQLDSPLGWLSRDHRKMLSVDGGVAYITGVCVCREWMGDPQRGIDPWRDTGVEIHGPAVAEVDKSFARIWASMGSRLPEGSCSNYQEMAGDMNVRIIATEPATAGMIRLDQLIAALARKRLWLTDAYFVGITVHIEALKAAARDGVDVRLMLPGTTDIPLLHKTLSRSGYRTLLEAGVRIFEWNGVMLHAKTAVADSTWARVGSTNLNVASWLANCELDAVIENETFALEMEAVYEADLMNATEIVLDKRHRPSAVTSTRRRHGRGTGSARRATVGALRIGHTVGGTLVNRRELGPIEARLTVIGGLLLLALSLTIVLYPKFLAYPVAALSIWGGLTLLYRAYRLALKAKKDRSQDSR